MDLQVKFGLLNQQKDQIKKSNRKYLRSNQNKLSKVVGNDDKVAGSNDDANPNDDKIMNYTIKQVEAWNYRKSIRKSNKLTNSTYSNYNKLAELSYYKNLKDIAKVGADIDGKQDTNRGDLLANMIKQQNARRMGKRSRELTASAGFINDKNNQFNLKLEREGKR